MRFRFTIRDLLWLTLVVALAVGWWIDSRRVPRYVVVEKKAGVTSAVVLGDTQTGKMWILIGDEWKPMP